ncbi:MAG: Sensory transduction histidine kinase [Nitrospira sp.]|nr:Sensory transduction histidine kinase [Nitrospira sp.]
MPRLGCTPSPAVPWGSHFCSYYQSTSDLQQLMHSFLQTGLEDHEGCLWILPLWHTPTTATTALQWVIPEVYDYLSTGQLELISSADWYGPQGPMDLQRIIANGRPKIAQMSARFGGMRVAGDSSWVQSPDQRGQFVEYERIVHDTVQTANVLALCTYPAAGWSPSDMLNMFTNHRSVLLPDQRGWRQVDVRCV